MKTVQVKIKGLTPLMLHRFNEEDEQKGSSRKMLIKNGTPREEAQKCVYLDKENNFFFPGAAISRMLRESGGNHKMRGTRKSAKYIVPAAVLVRNEIILIRDEQGRLSKNYEVDSRPVVIPATKGRIMRHRPRWDSWTAEFDLMVNESLLPVDLIHQLLVEGGQQVGIGEYRPEKGGPFGTFSVVLWKEGKAIEGFDQMPTLSRNQASQPCGVSS
jgi:hypothetical protein